MTSEKPVEPIRPGRRTDLIDVMVTLERPSSERLRSYNRQEKYALLKRSTEQVWEGLNEWIEAEALSEEFSRVGEPTVFNTLFVTCTPGAAERLLEAPGVVSVFPIGDFAVDLLPGRVVKSSTPEPDSDATDGES